MSSSYSTLRDSLQKTLHAISVTLAEQHTVSIEYTVMREKGLPPSLHIEILFLPAENENQRT